MATRANSCAQEVSQLYWATLASIISLSGAWGRHNCMDAWVLTKLCPVILGSFGQYS